MPQNTPMKRQFTTIDGRTVMSNLPQHWGGNDWKITGVDNPLPVGNYVQTEAGVWIPQKGSDDGAADVRLTGSIVEQKLFENININPGSSASLFNLKKFGLKVGIGVRLANSGSVRLSVRPDDKETTFGALGSAEPIVTIKDYDRGYGIAEVPTGYAAYFLINTGTDPVSVLMVKAFHFI